MAKRPGFGEAGRKEYEHSGAGLRKGKGRRKKEVAGPYRSQSTVPEIREKSTPREHRKVTPKFAEPEPFETPDISEPQPKRPGAKKAKQEERRERKAMRKARRILREADEEVDADLGVEDSPQFQYQRAKYHGEHPSEDLQRKHPRAYEKAVKAFGEYHAEHQGLKEDPLAEFVISTAATAGVGGVAGLAGKALGKAAGDVVASGGAKVAATEGAEIAGRAVSKGLTARTATKGGQAARGGAKALPRRVGRRIKEAPGKTKRAATTREGRQGVKRAEGRRLRSAGKRARRKPVRYTGGGYAVAPVAGVETEAAKRANALAEGTKDAVIENPIGTAKATGRGLAGIVTGPIALGRAGVESAITGNPDALENTASQEIEGVKELAGKLLSGDPEEVQETVENDAGLAPFVPLAAVGRLKPYKRGKRAVRKGAAAGRRKAAKVTGSKRIRVVPPERAGESYVFGPLERRADRRRVAKQGTKATKPRELEAAHFQNKILKALKKAPITRSLRNRYDMEAGDLLQTLAEYGIRTPKDVKFVRKHGPAGEIETGKVNLAAALDFARQHPEVLRDKHFSKALDAYIESAELLPAAVAGKGRRAKAMPQGDMFGITRPEDRVPMAAREYTRATTRAGAWQQAQRREKAIHRDRGKGRKLADQAQVAKGAEREALKAEASKFYAAARKAEEKNAALVKALGKYSRPGQALRASARRKYYDEPLLREYEAEVGAAREQAGLAAPAWTHQGKAREPGGIAPPYPAAAGRAQHMRSGVLAAADRVDRSLRALISGSVVSPRLRAGGQEYARSFTEAEMLPVKVGSKNKFLVTADEWSKAVESGQFSARHHVLFPARQFKQAVLDPFKSQADMSIVAGRALEQGLKADSKGSKYVVVRKESAKEFAAQINPSRFAGEEFVNAMSKGASRTLLFSPAWLMIQSVAEAIPMALAHPELLNPAKVAQLELRVRKNLKLNPSEAKAFAATAGEAPTALRTPSAMRPELESNPHGVFSDGARALTRSKLGQATFSVARLRPFAVFDQWRTGKYRELLLAAEADKQLNGWMAGLKGTLHIQKRISDDLRKLPKHEQLAALTKPKYRKLMDEMQRHVEAVSGDWQTFTRYERNFAPFLVFYPFIRYSLRWPLTFAKQHPVSTTVAAFLGQQNAEQIEKILGHAPSNPLAYAMPVWQDNEGDSRILTTGQRAAPGLSAPTQAIVSNEPSQALSVFNPLIGAGLTGLTGVNAYTGRQEPERGKQAADLLLAASPILRYFDVDTADVAGLAGIDIGEPESIAGKRFEQIDRDRAKRSLLEPWGDITAKQFREGEGFSRDLGTKYSDPVPELTDNPEISAAIYGTNGKGGWIRGEKGPLRKILRQHKVSEKASDRVRKQEEPFFTDEELTPEQEERASEAYRLLNNGYISFKPEPSRSDRMRKELGLPPRASTSDLRAELGLPPLEDTADLRKSLGIP